MSDLVRVGVVAGRRRVDLALPAMLPVVDLVPVLLRSLSVGEVERCHLAEVGGTALLPERGLRAQGVVDGALLHLSEEPSRPPEVHDDLAELVGAIVADRPGASTVHLDRATVRAKVWSAAGAAAVLVAGLGQLARPSAWGSAALLGATVGIVGLGGRLRGQQRAQAWVLLALALAAATIGLLTLDVLTGWSRADRVARNLVLAGCSLGIVGAGVIAAWRAHRGLVVVPAVLCAVLVIAAALDLGVGLTAPLAVVLASTTALLVGLGVPWWSAGRVCSHAAGGSVLVRAAVTADVARAHELAVSSGAVTGLLLVLLASSGTALGGGGVALATTSVLLVAARARHHRDAVESAAWASAAAVGGLALVVSVLAARPGWSPAVVALAALGGSLVSWSPGRAVLGARTRRCWQVVEMVCTVSLAPLVVTAAGGLDLVRGLVS